MKLDYKVRDAMGEIHEGQLQADSREKGTKQLESDGFQVLEINEVSEFSLFAAGVKQNEIIYVTSQLAIMVDTGITLSTALNGICEQTDNPTLKAVLADLRNQVESGEDFSAALSKYPKYFDRTFVALIKASEQTGTLGEMLERISGYMTGQLETRAKVKSAMMYPAVIFVLAVGVTIFLLTFVLPKFTPLFARKGVVLPVPTRIILCLSDVMTNYWYLLLGGVAAAVGGYIFAKRNETGRMAIDWVWIHMPVLGALNRKLIVTRCLSTLGTMLQSGVSVLDCIRLCAEISGNYWYEKAWLHVMEEITQGNRIAESLKGNNLFPKTLIQMMGSGEEAGRLDYVLKKVSGFYDREIEISIKSAMSLIEPLMISVMGAVVGTIGMGIMLPIFQLSRAAH